VTHWLLLEPPLFHLLDDFCGLNVLFYSWRALLLWSTFSGIRSRLDVAWDWRCSSVFNTSPGLIFLLFSFCVCVSFVGSWDLGSGNSLLPFVNHQSIFSGGFVFQAASGAGFVIVYFFYGVFLWVVQTELFRSLSLKRSFCIQFYSLKSAPALSSLFLGVILPASKVWAMYKPLQYFWIFGNAG